MPPFYPKVMVHPQCTIVLISALKVVSYRAVKVFIKEFTYETLRVSVHWRVAEFCKDIG